MAKFLIMAMVHIRWAYFHVNPMYVKFYMDSEHTESHFQHRTRGSLHSNMYWQED